MTSRIIAGVVLASAVALGAQPAGRAPRNAAEFDALFQQVKNWGRWGPDDQLGSINLITPATRKQAIALAKTGESVSLAHTLLTEKADDNASPFEHTMNQGFSTDTYRVSYHGYAHTHIDGFAHRFFDGKMWNGFSYEEVTEAGGAQKNSIYNLHNGVVTRGVLIDIPRLKGVDYLEPGTRIFIEDIEAWEKQAGVKVAAGDAVFIRTGRWARRAKTGPWNAAIENAGLDPSVLPWLKRRDVAILGSEGAQDAVPPPTGSELGGLALHDFALIVLGINLLDDTNLEALSQTAAARKRWEFMLVVGPLPVTNGTGSPVNPIAVF